MAIPRGLFFQKRFALAEAARHSFIAMSDRELVLETIQEMPETVSLREIVDELQIMAVTRERMEKNPKGEGVSAEELLRQVSSWVIT
jgi:hypothetical protein